MMLMPEESKRKVLKITDLLSIKQAAIEKGVTTRAIYQRIDRGLMPVVEAGEVRMVYRRDLDEWEVDRTKQKQKRRKPVE